MEEGAKKFLGNLLDLVGNVVEAASLHSDSTEAEDVVTKGEEKYRSLLIPFKPYQL